MLEVDFISHFVSVLQCTHCDNSNCKNLLRDAQENLPQPGYIGANYFSKRVLLVGQNPGVSTAALSQPDGIYTSALRVLRDHPSMDSWSGLRDALINFVPLWPVTGRHFPLRESELSLEDIAYCNLVRCRTIGNATPSAKMTGNCASLNFRHTLDILEPVAIVFIGKWSMNNGSEYAKARSIPFEYIDRNRSLTLAARTLNHERVADFIRTRLLAVAPEPPSRQLPRPS